MQIKWQKIICIFGNLFSPFLHFKLQSLASLKWFEIFQLSLRKTTDIFITFFFPGKIKMYYNGDNVHHTSEILREESFRRVLMNNIIQRSHFQVLHVSYDCLNPSFYVIMLNLLNSNWLLIASRPKTYRVHSQLRILS